MSTTSQKHALRALRSHVNTTNWLLRAFGRSIRRSLTSGQRDGLARLLAIGLSLVFFQLFPYLVVAAYMSWEGFFSYDMFTHGVSGLTAFYWWSELFLIVASVYMLGALHFIVISVLQRREIVPVRSLDFWFALAWNALVAAALFFSGLKLPSGFTSSHVGGLYLIAAWVVVHGTILLHATGRAALRSLMVGVVILVSLATLHPGTLALPYTLSLQYFGNGGGLPAAVQLLGKQSIAGTLVLMTPENVYFYPSGQTQITVIPRREVLHLSVSNLSGFGHAKSQGMK